MQKTVSQFKRSLTHVRGQFPWFIKPLRSGNLVAHIRWGIDHDAPQPPALESQDGVLCLTGKADQECWLHVALYYDRPVRPTFLVMRRDRLRDNGALIGLEPCRTSGSICQWVTMWEAFGDIIDYRAEDLRVTWYELKAFVHKRVSEIRPFRQQVQKTEIPIVGLRAMVPPSRKRRNASQGRGRGVPGASATSRGNDHGRGSGVAPSSASPHISKSPTLSDSSPRSSSSSSSSSSVSSVGPQGGGGGGAIIH